MHARTKHLSLHHTVESSLWSYYSSKYFTWIITIAKCELFSNSLATK